MLFSWGFMSRLPLSRPSQIFKHARNRSPRFQTVNKADPQNHTSFPLLVRGNASLVIQFNDRIKLGFSAPRFSLHRGSVSRTTLFDERCSAFEFDPRQTSHPSRISAQQASTQVPTLGLLKRRGQMPFRPQVRTEENACCRSTHV